MYIPPSLLPELSVLLVIAEETHFGRAAERLNVSQPRISQIVRRIEDVVGYEIFIRRPRVRPTPAGEILIQVARQALGDLQAGSVRAAEVAAGRGGAVRLGYAPGAMLTPLPALLKAFCSHNPSFVLQLHGTYSANLWAGLEAGSFDVIVSREARVRPGIQNRLFLRDNLVAALPEDDPSANQAELPVTSLRDRDVIGIDQSIAPQWHHALASFCQSAGFELRVTQTANDWAAILALVASGLGVSIVSSTIAQLRFPGVAFVPLAEGAAVGAFWVTSHDAAPDPAVRLLRSALLDRAGANTR